MEPGLLGGTLGVAVRWRMQPVCCIAHKKKPHLVQEDSKSSPPDADPLPCGKCGGAFDLLTRLPRVGDHPTYQIFHCAACGFVEWIAETIAP